MLINQLKEFLTEKEHFEMINDLSNDLVSDLVLRMPNRVLNGRKRNLTIYKFIEYPSSKAMQLWLNNEFKNEIMSITFFKADKTVREITCRTGVKSHLAGGKSTVDKSRYYNVFDMQLNGYRNVNLSTILEVRGNKCIYKFPLIEELLNNTDALSTSMVKGLLEYLGEKLKTAS